MTGPWLAVLAGPVCDLTFITPVGGAAREQLDLLFSDLQIAGLVGVRNWLGSA